MWTQRLTGPYRFEKVEAVPPAAADLRRGEVLLATTAGGICGSDLPYFRGAPVRLAGQQPGPVTPGPGFPLHEIVGRVVASTHPDHEVGDMVVGWATGFDGIAELVVSHGDALCRYDTSIPDTTAVMLQPLACVLYAAERIGEVRGKAVAVIGQGPIGLLFSHVLKQRGARLVIGVDRVDRSGAGHVFGVDEVVTADAAAWSATLRDPDRPDVVVEAVGHQVSTMTACIDSVAFGGEVYYFGLPADPVYPLDMVTFLHKNLTLRSGGTLERRRVLDAANTYVAAYPQLRDSYVSHIYDAGDVQDAFEAAIHPTPGQYKIAIDLS